MKLRTEIEITPWQRTIDYHSRILSIGSCFAQNIAERLTERKFNIATSPSGILFNPASIARTIERFRQRREVCADDLFQSDGRWLQSTPTTSLAKIFAVKKPATLFVP